MATALTTNLKLRVPSTLDTDSRFNLFKLDSLGASGLFDSSGILTLRSTTDISFRPGNGVGGDVTFNHKIDTFDINATTININSDALFTGGFSIPKINLDLSTLVAADVTDFDAEVSNNTSVTLNTSHRNTSNIHFTEASIDHINITNTGSNTHAQIDSHISSTSNPHTITAAQVGAYTTGETDILLNDKAALLHTHSASDITDFTSSVASTASVTANTTHRGTFNNPHAVTAAQVGADTSAEVTTKISAHNTSSGIHGVAGNVVGTSDTQTITNKVFNAINNTLTEIADTNIATAAAIAGTKISPDFGNQVINTQDGITFEEGGFKVKLQGAQAGMAADFVLELPPADGSNGQVLATNGSGELEFVSVSGVGSTDHIETWLNADGTSKTASHNFGTRNVMVQVIDVSDSYKNIDVDVISRPNDNDVILSTSSAPATSWVILIHKLT